MPIKVNVHAWKMRLDCLPTRLNISQRGMDIDSILCLICDNAVESSRLIFFNCNVAREILRKIARWWDVSYMEVSSYEELYTLCRFSFKQRKGIRVYTEPSLPEVQGVAFSEGPHVNTIGNMQARHNQLLNTTYVILEAATNRQQSTIIRANGEGSSSASSGGQWTNSSILFLFRINDVDRPTCRCMVPLNLGCQHEPYGISKEPKEVLEVRGQGELNTYKVLKAHLTDSLHAGLALGDLNSVKDLYDFKTLSVLFLIGFISIVPTILKRKRIYK
ncbi:RNA-directed DNA polymerase, eukaryota [Tanacetum coccineum]